ncbi:MAG: 2-polyprenyl-3-methyl-5-hydroxy-6-metoxy-1,4-benzoquinol methylase, partial [Akkermansiaceae bacterium]
MSDVYETNRYVGEYLLFHYAKANEILPWQAGPVEALDFPVRTVAHFSEGRVERSLDVGCAVGRSTLEMSRTSEEVVGIDFSNAFIEAAEKMRLGNGMICERLEEAESVTAVEVSR